MNWINSKQEIPKHEEMVLICVDRSVFAIGTFDEFNRCFTYADHHGGKAVWIERSEVHWLRLTIPID